MGSSATLTLPRGYSPDKQREAISSITLHLIALKFPANNSFSSSRLFKQEREQEIIMAVTCVSGDGFLFNCCKKVRALYASISGYAVIAIDLKVLRK
jgi:hypothetical protein